MNIIERVNYGLINRCKLVSRLIRINNGLIGTLFLFISPLLILLILLISLILKWIIGTLILVINLH